jgi:hypothetical protein
MRSPSEFPDEIIHNQCNLLATRESCEREPFHRRRSQVVGRRVAGQPVGRAAGQYQNASRGRIPIHLNGSVIAGDSRLGLPTRKRTPNSPNDSVIPGDARMRSMRERGIPNSKSTAVTAIERMHTKSEPDCMLMRSAITDSSLSTNAGSFAATHRALAALDDGLKWWRCIY